MVRKICMNQLICRFLVFWVFLRALRYFRSVTLIRSSWRTKAILQISVNDVLQALSWQLVRNRISDGASYIV